jgi:hypothetical protein
VKSFQTGKLTFPLESKQVGGYFYGSKAVARGFDTLSPFSPVKVPHTSLIDLREDSTASQAQLQSIIQESKLTEVRSQIYEKPLAVIFNPSSGKKTDLRPLLKSFFDGNKIGYQLFETTGYMHAWKICQEEINDLEEFAVLVAIGGDGTLHEAINGMMSRTDGKRIPVAFIPNGTGNDTCNSIGIATVEQALSFILKGDSIKVDLNLCMMDA